MAKLKSPNHPLMTEGSDNPFADLGFKKAELEMARSRLVTEMANVIEARKMSRAKAAKIVGLSQPMLSRLLGGHWKRYSMERLARCLTKLGVTVRLTLERNSETWTIGHLIVGRGKWTARHSNDWLVQNT